MKKTVGVKFFKKGAAAFAALLLLVSIFSPLTAEAATTKVTALKKGKTYTCDLNGGKKEKIRYTFSACDYERDRPGKFCLYVNNKKVYSRKLYALGIAEVSLVDTNKKDRYTEIYVHTITENACIADLFVLRYYGPKKVKAYDSTDRAWAGHAVRLAVEGKNTSIIKNTGKNKLYLYCDTPFNNQTFGMYFVKVPVRLKNGKMEFMSADTYDFVKTYGIKSYYKLAKKMTLYKTASTKKKVTALKSGTQFKVQKIKPVNAKKYGDGGADLFVKIKTKSGRSGWLYFPNSSKKQILKFTPGWA